MYGSAYYGARFFGKRYFGVGGDPTPPATLPVSLPAAMASLVNGWAGITDFPGGYRTNSLSLKSEYPAIVGTIREGNTEIRSSSYDRVMVPIVLRVYAENPDDAYELSKSLDAAVVGHTLDFEGALVTKLLRDGEPRMGWQAARSPSGRIDYTERKYCCRVRRPTVIVVAS
jgi:hypothetical protein